MSSEEQLDARQMCRPRAPIHLPTPSTLPGPTPTTSHLLVWPLHRHAPVKAAGPQEGGVQHVWPVGGGNADDQLVLAGVKAVQLWVSEGCKCRVKRS